MSKVELTSLNRQACLMIIQTFTEIAEQKQHQKQRQFLIKNKWIKNDLKLQLNHQMWDQDKKFKHTWHHVKKTWNQILNNPMIPINVNSNNHYLTYHSDETWTIDDIRHLIHIPASGRKPRNLFLG